MMQPVRAQSPKHTDSSFIPVSTQSGWAEDPDRQTSPKQTPRRLLGTWKDTQQGQPSEKCKSTLPWGTSSHQPEWPSSKCSQIPNSGEIAEKRVTAAFYMHALGGNADWCSHLEKQHRLFEHSSQHSTQSKSVCRRGQDRMAKWMNIGLEDGI